MKVGFWPLLSLMALMALALVALAACARSNRPQGLGTNPGAGAPASIAPGGPAPARGGSAPAQGGSAPAQGGPAPARGGSAPARGGSAPSSGGQRTPASYCPSETPLDPGAGARDAAIAAAEAAVPQRYPPRVDVAGFQVTNAYLADPASGYGAIAYGLCGPTVGQRTWVVELSFPKMAPSVDLSAGQLFLSRFPDGWKVWFQYH